MAELLANPAERRLLLASAEQNEQQLSSLAHSTGGFAFDMAQFGRELAVSKEGSSVELRSSSSSDYDDDFFDALETPEPEATQTPALALEKVETRDQLKSFVAQSPDCLYIRSDNLNSPRVVSDQRPLLRPQSTTESPTQRRNATTASSHSIEVIGRKEESVGGTWSFLNVMTPEQVFLRRKKRQEENTILNEVIDDLDAVFISTIEVDPARFEGFERRFTSGEQ
ncbi:hypothetical protein B0T19DRAFT_438210 [Cercophora scortea]|uniref:Uncharacterized protein n=1 Tax=Cercophora scortea TaxID=314031 RepID=A0AAE0J6N5_9PEZI|nr:hypothetical protein B0T19DRAFT_438210 [Cercophora scortea]